MFMHGTPMHSSRECVDMAFTYVRRMSSPGAVRITGGSSRPLNEKAAFPVWGSLTAVRTKGEWASGGFERSGWEARWPGSVAACAANRMLPQVAKRLKTMNETVHAFESRVEIIMGC